MVSGHLPFVHFQIQLASPNCTQITSITKVKVSLVILIYDTSTRHSVRGWLLQFNKQQRVIRVQRLFYKSNLGGDRKG